MCIICVHVDVFRHRQKHTLTHGHTHTHMHVLTCMYTHAHTHTSKIITMFIKYLTNTSTFTNFQVNISNFSTISIWTQSLIMSRFGTFAKFNFSHFWTLLLTDYSNLVKIWRKVVTLQPIVECRIRCKFTIIQDMGKK